MMSVEIGLIYHFTIGKESDVAKATSVTQQFAEEIGFSPVLQAIIATTVSELATNIFKYAGLGRITIGFICQMGRSGIEIIAEDQGPGISNREKAMSDRFSTGGTLGLGLPSVRRMMDEFLMDSSEGFGTKIVVRKWMPDTIKSEKYIDALF